jgi:hypothetical protein
MSLPESGSLEALSLAELRGLVGVLLAEVRRLQSDNAILQDKVEAQQARIMTLQTENQVLRDEVARLKGLPPRPTIRPSGMEKATEPAVGAKGRKRSKPRWGAKRDRDAVTKEIVVKATVPAGSRFKGFEDILVRDLRNHPPGHALRAGVRLLRTFLRTHLRTFLRTEHDRDSDIDWTGAAAALEGG